MARGTAIKKRIKRKKDKFKRRRNRNTIPEKDTAIDNDSSSLDDTRAQYSERPNTKKHEHGEADTKPGVRAAP